MQVVNIDQREYSPFLRAMMCATRRMICAKNFFTELSFLSISGLKVVGEVKKVGKSRNFHPKVGKSENFLVFKVGILSVFLITFLYTGTYNMLVSFVHFKANYPFF